MPHRRYLLDLPAILAGTLASDLVGSRRAGPLLAALSLDAIEAGAALEDAAEWLWHVGRGLVFVVALVWLVPVVIGAEVVRKWG